MKALPQELSVPTLLHPARCLNVGCGGRYAKTWTNIDCFDGNPYVINCDLSKGIPFASESFDVVYHSHLLEHFNRGEGGRLLKECFRVLKPGGIIRVAVPDLEQIVRQYLELLQKVDGNAGLWPQYEWILLELFDQVSRDKSGGQLADFMMHPEVPTAFIRERWGVWARDLLDPKTEQKPDKRSFWKKQWDRFAYYPTVLKERGLKIILGRQDYEALRVGRFRRGGEVHRWMYDSHSLTRALTSAGFENPMKKTATQSQIENWSAFALDTEPDGSIYKADSLYMEASRP